MTGHGEQVSTYRDRLAEMFRAKFEEMDLAIIDTGESAEFADAVVEVRDAELNTLSAENTRLAAEVERLNSAIEGGIQHSGAEIARAESAEAQLAEAKEQLRLSNIDAVTNEADLAEAKRKNEDLLSSVAGIASRLRSWINDPKATVTHAGAIVADLEALADPPDLVVDVPADDSGFRENVQRASAVFARLRQMVDAWEQTLPETIRTAVAAQAIRAELPPEINPPPGDTP